MCRRALSLWGPWVSARPQPLGCSGGVSIPPAPASRGDGSLRGRGSVTPTALSQPCRAAYCHSRVMLKTQQPPRLSRGPCWVRGGLAWSRARVGRRQLPADVPGTGWFLNGT